jgi:hypothetical protein
MQFIQANSTLIFFGLALVFMLWMHGGGHRHGMGGGMGHEHGSTHQHDGLSADGGAENPTSGQIQTAPPVADQAGSGGRSAGCH